MIDKFYKYPLNFEKFFENENFDSCNLGESISQNIQLIIVSNYGQHRFNKSLGSYIWDLDFDLMMNIKKWEDKFRSSFINALLKHEKSISQINLTVAVSEVEKDSFWKEYSCIKRQVYIEINAILVKTGESYKFTSQLFLSPMSSY